MEGQGKVQPVAATLATFLISLPDSDRRGEALRALAEAGLRPDVVAACNGGSPAARQAYRSWRARLFCGRELAPGEVGCFVSHRIAAARFLATDAAFGLVFEDDVAPHGNAQDTLATLNHALPQAGWDILHLGAAPGFLHRPVAVLGAGNRLLRAHYFPLGSHAILWSRDGAQRFLATTGRIALPLDHFLRRWTCRSGRGLALACPLFGTRGVASEIDSGPLRQRLVSGRPYRMRRALRRWRNKSWAAFRAHLPAGFHRGDGRE